MGVIMEILARFLDEYAIKLLYTAITAIAGAAGVILKHLISRNHRRKTKKRVIRSCLKAAVCVYKDLSIEEKYHKLISSISEILLEKSIYISEIEIMLLISQEYELFKMLKFDELNFDKLDLEKPLLTKTASGREKLSAANVEK